MKKQDKCIVIGAGLAGFLFLAGAAVFANQKSEIANYIGSNQFALLGILSLVILGAASCVFAAVKANTCIEKSSSDVVCNEGMKL